MTLINRMTKSGLLGGTLLLAGACATVQPSPELVNARNEYSRAAAGPTASVNPTGLYEAKKSLDYANSEFARDPDAPKSQDMAYIALRKIQLAEAQTSVMQATASSAQSAKDKQKATDVALTDTKKQLNDSNTALQSSNTALQSSNSALQTSNANLDAAMASLAKSASVRQEPRGMVITLSGSVLFRSSSATLLPTANARLNDVANALQQSGGDHFTVEGFTDSTGSDATNQDLSTRRAQTVRDYLIDRGVPTEKLAAQGYGSARPIAGNETAEGRANNRRVEIVVASKPM